MKGGWPTLTPPNTGGCPTQASLGVGPLRRSGTYVIKRWQRRKTGSPTACPELAAGSRAFRDAGPVRRNPFCLLDMWPMYAHIYTYNIICKVFHVKHFDVLYPGPRPSRSNCEQSVDNRGDKSMIRRASRPPDHGPLGNCPITRIYTEALSAAGSVNKKVDPWLSSLSARIVPPCASTMCLAMASPSPVPPDSRERALSTR